MENKELTLIVPAKPGSFNKNKKFWQAVRIAKSNWNRILYIAIYESGKIGKITYYAKVKEIKRLPKNDDEKTPKCKIYIEGEWHNVNCKKRQYGEIVVQNIRYTKFVDFDKNKELEYMQIFK